MTWVKQEFVVQHKNGDMDWVDPVVSLEETETEIIVHNGYYEYRFNKENIDKWCVRNYSPETTFDPVEAETQ